MGFDLENDGNLNVSRFEIMLKTNEVGFFDSEEFEDIIEYYLEVGKITTARKAISLAITQHPSSVSLKLYQSEMLILDDKFEQAADVLDQLYNIEPGNPEIFIQKANILSKTERHKLAIELLEHAVTLTEDHADIFNLIGMEYLFCDEYSMALQKFLRSLEADTGDDAALYNVIYCYEYLDNHAEAIEFLNEFLDKEPYNKIGWHQLGKLFFDLQEYQDALQAYDFAIISDDGFIGAYLEKGKVLERLGRIEEAIEVYSLTLTMDDPTAYAYHRLGICYQLIGNDTYAIRFFKSAVDEDPLSDKAWKSIVDYYIDKDMHTEALFYAEKAVDIDPDNAAYWERFAIINNSLNLLEEAEYGYRRSIELGNLELDLWEERADILYKLGEMPAAILSLEQGLEIHPQVCSLLYRLAAMHYLYGQHLKGRFYLDTAMRNDQSEDNHSCNLLENYPDLCLIPELDFLKTA